MLQFNAKVSTEICQFIEARQVASTLVDKYSWRARASSFLSPEGKSFLTSESKSHTGSEGRQQHPGLSVSMAECIQRSKKITNGANSYFRDTKVSWTMGFIQLLTGFKEKPFFEGFCGISTKALVALLCNRKLPVTG